MILALSAIGQDREFVKNTPIADPLVQELWDSLWVLNEQHRYYETFPLLHQIVIEAERTDENRVLAYTYENLGSLHYYKGEMEQALDNFLKAYDVYKNNEAYGSLCLIMTRVSNIYQHKGNMEKAMHYAYEAKGLLKYTTIKPPFITVHNDLGALYHINGQFDSSYHYKKIVLDNVDPTDTVFLNRANNNMASSFVSIYDYDKAEEYMNTALRYTNKKKHPLTFANTLADIGILESFKGNNYKAEEKLKEGILILETSKNGFRRLLEYYPAYADVLIKNNKLERAEAILQKADSLIQDDNQELKIAYLFPKWDLAIRNKKVELAKEIHIQILPLFREDQLSNSVRFYGLESNYFKLIGENDKALASLTKSVSLKDELRSIQNVRAIENLELKYDTEKKDLEIYAANDRIRFQTYGMIIGGVMLISLLFLLLRNTRNRKKIMKQNSFITNSLSEKEILLKEIHHRVKNNLQVISSLLSIQSRSIKNVKAKEAILEGRTRVHSMSLIHQDLYKKDNLTGVRMDRYLGSLTRDLLDTYNVSEGKISLNNDIEPLKLDVESVIPLGLIVNELMSNALKYAFPEDRDGVIDVLLKEEDGYLYLKVADNGIGLDEKQLKVKQDSFGHTLIRAFRSKLDAEIDISANRGTIVSLKIAKYKKVV